MAWTVVTLRCWCSAAIRRRTDFRKLGGEIAEPCFRMLSANVTSDLQYRCVGIAIDLGRQLLYWSQKGPPKGGLGAIYRCPLTPPPPGYTFSNRPDITTLFSFLPEPIDLQLDLVEQRLYWSDRGAGPDGNSLNSAYVGESEKMLLQQWEEDGERGYNVLRTGFQEAIGLALDVSRKRCFVADLEGGLFQIALDGTWSKTLFRGELGAVTGITLAEL